MNNQNKFDEYRIKYPNFRYKSYEYKISNVLEIIYHFEIDNLAEFNPVIKIDINNNNYNKEYLEYLIFQIGLIELISYVKCTCSKNIIIEAGYVNDMQIKFLKKLYFNGLGELLYRNNISTTMDDLFNIICTVDKIKLPHIEYIGNGNIICVGGGKDSCVSLELLKNEDNMCLIINPKTPSLECSYKAGYSDDKIIKVERVLDRKIIDLNNKGFLNGHTPLSALIAFISYLCAYLYGRKNIVLSNESSANEETVLGTNINHQYSKTFEFENDFREYCKLLNLDINYFSLLRGLSEYNIAKLFSNYKKYHKVFRSCNLGSKNEDWQWCCNCSKCIFIYIILSPFLSKEERINIFGEDLYDKKDLLNTFIEILGYSKSKPFDCVGTYNEARLAVSKVIIKQEKGYLLDYYRKHFDLYLDDSDIIKYNEENNLLTYNSLVKKELDKYD
ncbi:MAG: hypothetical protein II119_01950 [Bacilli bacterium]|nr:hypothetical protein [Bacilli bacterium]